MAVSEAAIIPEPPVDRWPDPPQLLVEWSSPWREFKTAFRPAFTRAPKALAGEAPVGIFPYRGMLGGWLLECLLFIALVVIPQHIASMQPFQPPAPQKWDVIYYSGDELPQTADRGGAQSGKSGRAGGQQAHHATQTIRVAHGDRPAERVVDAPNINLPHSDSAVANLLALKANPGPPPSEGLRSRTAPTLPAMNAVAPSPDLDSSSSRTQANLSSTIIAPPPEVSHASTRDVPTMNPSLIAPAPDAVPNKLRAASPLTSNVVAPAPKDAPRDLASSRAPLSQTTNVIAPPVSAPARDSASVPKMSLPAPAVVAPPPSQVNHDLNSWGATRSGDIRSQAVPVPPPPSTAGGTALARSSNGGALNPQIVPPPASIDGQGSGSGRPGAGTQTYGLTGAELGASTVVPPPPGLGGGQALSGSGRGNRGSGAGGPLDLGSSVAPPTSSGANAAGTGVVISSAPGSKVGLPNSTGGGAIAMSPSGTAKTGLGGSGGGTGIGRGNGPGSGLTGEGSGAGKEGVGHGSDPNARAGISPYPGSGGTGNGSSGSPAMPGVSVEGGTTTVTLPSFGGPGGDSPTSGPGRSSTNGRGGPSYTIEATPRSGGVFAYYGYFKGDRNYSIYIDTSIGTAVMQFADASSATHTTASLTAPEPMRKELPAGLRPTRVIIACILDRTGTLKNLKVLEPGTADATSKILVALQSWKFRPAFRGNDPVEVNAILGFGVDTR